MIDALVGRIIGRTGLRVEIATSTVGSLGLKIVNTLINLASSVLLARILAPEGFGIYTFALSIVTLLAIPVQLGLPTLVLREVAKYSHSERWNLIRGILRRSEQTVLLLSLGIGLLTVVVIWWLAGRGCTTQLATIACALPLLLLISLSRLRDAALQGLRKVVQGQLADSLLRPLFLIVFLALGIVSLNGRLSPQLVMAFYCAAACLALLISSMMLRRSLPSDFRSVPAGYDLPAWTRSVLFLSLLDGLSVIISQADIFMLGLLSTKVEVGLYRVAFSGAALIIFTQTSISVVMSPYIARLYSAGDRVRLQRLVTKCTRLALLTALPVAGLLICFGKPILGHVFGKRYEASYLVMAILCFGQLVNVAVGPVNIILNMTGHERETLQGVVVAAILSVVLDAAMIPSFGAAGAAMASTISIIFVNLFLWYKVWVLLRLQSAAFSVST